MAQSIFARIGSIIVAKIRGLVNAAFTIGIYQALQSS
jgi:hypothetical protein